MDLHGYFSRYLSFWEGALTAFWEVATPSDGTKDQPPESPAAAPERDETMSDTQDHQLQYELEQIANQIEEVADVLEHGVAVDGDGQAEARHQTTPQE